MSNVVSITAGRRPGVISVDAGTTLMDLTGLPEPGSPEARENYYQLCEEMLASFKSGKTGAVAALAAMNDPILAWIEGDCTMRQLVVNEICRTVGIEPEEVAKWQL